MSPWMERVSVLLSVVLVSAAIRVVLSLGRG
jgi:hypothetical protein